MHKTIMTIDSFRDPSGMFKENERVLNEYGGVVVVRELSYEEVKSTYMRKGKEYPFFLVPERYESITCVIFKILILII